MTTGTRTQEPHHFISAVILLMALAVIGLSASLWVRANGYHAQTQRVLTATDASDALMRATATRALERGLSFAALGDPAGLDARLRERLEEVRRVGDTQWQRAMERTRDLTANLPNAALREHQLQVERQNQRLLALRDSVDAAPENRPHRLSDTDWLEATSNLMDAATALHELLLVAAEMPPEVALLADFVARRVWTASEYAGRERGILSYYLAARQLPPEAQLARLATYRALVDHQLQRLLGLKRDETLPEGLRRALHAADIAFNETLEPLRARVYEDFGAHEIRIAPADWFNAYTSAMEALLGVVAEANALISAQARQARGEANRDRAFAFALMCSTLALGWLSVTRVRRTANDLFEKKQLAEVTLHSIGDAVITTDTDARVEYLNPVAEELTGRSPGEARGRHLREVFPVVNGVSRRPVANPAEICLREQRIVGLENGSVLLARNGREIAVEDSAAPITDRNGRIIGAVLVFYDASSMRHAPQLLSYHATHDPLTRLINRREFERRLAELLTRARTSDQEHALCYIDLDQFKVVNDVCGHGAGDRLLSQLAFVLRNAVRNVDTLARLGGDEFGLLLEGCPIAQAERIAGQINARIAAFRFVWEGRTFELGASVGVVPITAASVSAAEVLGEADAACFAAKEAGRNRVKVFEPGNLELARRRSDVGWVSELGEALAQNRFVLYCQPIAAVDGGGSVWGEILVRLVSRDGEIVSPMAFIPSAERYHLMHRIDRWVLEHGFARIGQLHREYPDSDARFNLNLSGASLSDESLGDHIRQLAKRHGAPPGRVCLEITESMAVADFERACRLVSSLSEAGFRFALDDFGTGLSSFSYLKHLPVDYLKIAGSLAEGIAHSAADYAMVEAIHSVGRAMGIATIVEHVSDADLLEAARRIGVDYVQGFVLAEPVPLEDFLRARALGTLADGPAGRESA